MKSFKDYINEELSVAEIQEDAIKAVDFIEKELNKLFKGKAFWARITSRLASNSSMSVNYFNVPKGSSEIEKLNANANARFIMHLRDKKGMQVPMSKFSYEELTMTPGKFSGKEKFLKFRKINGKSPMDASKKLIAWFKANKDILMGEFK
jgi:hypothetical protein